ncbi:hypothetical protein [Sorangium sp. So ce1078]|uniref:hypothetical protein n=1 Tax=Sorangium sp. So ce1078 TaxID=3133329 RepID=UPI003F636CEA
MAIRAFPTRRTPVGARAALCAGLSIALLSSHPAPARAQAAGASRPWHEGISEERKQRALEIFREARDLHRQMMLGEARAKYEEALAHWEHPDLRFYLGRVLKTMGLPLLAHENLRLALRWGPASLEPEDHAEARVMMRQLVERELAVLELRCDEPGAAVLLDGKPWFVGPGVEERFLMPGEHLISAKKDGYISLVATVTTYAGARASRVLSVDHVVTERMWPAWVPWAVVGAGAALVAVGGVLQWRSAERMNDLEQLRGSSCVSECELARMSAYSSARAEGHVAVGLFIAGGTTLAAGAALAYVNRPRSYRVDEKSGVKLEVVPVASDATAGMTARILF